MSVTAHITFSSLTTHAHLHTHAHTHTYGSHISIYLYKYTNTGCPKNVYTLQINVLTITQIIDSCGHSEQLHWIHTYL